MVHIPAAETLLLNGIVIMQGAPIFFDNDLRRSTISISIVSLLLLYVGNGSCLVLWYSEPPMVFQASMIFWCIIPIHRWRISTNHGAVVKVRIFIYSGIYRRLTFQISIKFDNCVAQGFCYIFIETSSWNTCCCISSSKLGVSGSIYWHDFADWVDSLCLAVSSCRVTDVF